MANHLILQPKIVSSNAWQSSDSFLMLLLYCAENVTWDLHSKIFKCRTQRCWVQAQGCTQISKKNSFSNRNFLAYFSGNKLSPFLSPWRHHCILWVLWLMRRNSSCAWHQTVFIVWVLRSAHHNSHLLSRVIKSCVFYGTFSCGLCHFKTICTSWIFKMLSYYIYQRLYLPHILILDSSE